MAQHDYVEGRKKVISILEKELVGPWPVGDEIDCSSSIEFTEADLSKLYQPWREKGTGEEILTTEGSPTMRYGVGVLYPASAASAPPDDEDEQEFNSIEQGLTRAEDREEAGEASEESEGARKDGASKDLEKILKRTARAKDGERDNDDDLGISSANQMFPACMGVTFLAHISENSKFNLEFLGATYESCSAKAGKRENNWWIRRPLSKNLFEINVSEETNISELISSNKPVSVTREVKVSEKKTLFISFEILVRDFSSEAKLVTVTVVNRSVGDDRDNELCVFQSHLNVFLEGEDGAPAILPYPEKENSDLEADDEEASLDLLYRNSRTFAIGHGASADWFSEEGDQATSMVSAISLPIEETPNITPEITRPDGSVVAVPMRPLAGLVEGDDGKAAIQEVIDLYEQWIDRKKTEAEELSAEIQRAAAARHIENCEDALKRMRVGLDFISNDALAIKAFELANHAILLQQLRFTSQARPVKFDVKEARVIFEGPAPDRDVLSEETTRGNWRPFQIAFLLMTAESAVDGNAPDRELVDLIWFPTGGGKTEAYLGLAAFSIFYRRLKNPQDAGTEVLMRYTLRLLTAQQFQRGAALVCAIEHLRKQDKAELGEKPVRIGIWLGRSMTPNRRDAAKSTLRKLKRSGSNEDNEFIITRCPWCGAPMGGVHYEGTRQHPREAPKVLGYKLTRETVVYECPDKRCDFSGGLPVMSIDEDIYADPPEIIIGTVDKFAQITWSPDTRAIFGLKSGGERQASPPGLIIQDELHLISGPLGSMVGLYEALIEDLCSEVGESGKVIKPKIVTSTATIRRFERQVKDLYNRQRTALFPPPGLDAGDSFFSKYARDKDGSLLPGRIYIGVHGAGLGSIQTGQVRTFTALLQASMFFSGREEMDPWWTLLIFFNSLRELQTTVSLFQQDIPARLEIIKKRLGLKYEKIRSIWNVKELTSRLRNHEVPEAIDLLSVPAQDAKYPVDVCLASNIIEVGVDIDRLSLMSVVGQPKTTSQYIQVTGRVGRRWMERPGLVATIFSPSKPRDRSHFEKFKSYHQKLYAQVEPTSVTPFAAPVVDRALHAVMAGYVRQRGTDQQSLSPTPCPEDLVSSIREILKERVKSIDEDELDNVLTVFDRRLRQWRQWGKLFWDQRSQDDATDYPLLRTAGSYATPAFKHRSWSTPNSMRNVDAECQAQISCLYTPAAEEAEDD